MTDAPYKKLHISQLINGSWLFDSQGLMDSWAFDSQLSDKQLIGSYILGMGKERNGAKSVQKVLLICFGLVRGLIRLLSKGKPLFMSQAWLGPSNDLRKEVKDGRPLVVVSEGSRARRQVVWGSTYPLFLSL